MTIKLIVGLANPGAKYVATRHNVGSLYVNLLAKYNQQVLKEESKVFGYTSQIKLSGNNVFLLIPKIFMNLSGKSVTTMANVYNISPKEILVVHDELNLLLGTARFKQGGSSNGHNGLKDIIKCLGNNSCFYRLRIGIGHPGDKNKVIEFVLGKPTAIEQKLINSSIEEAIRCTYIFFSKNALQAMNDLHTYRAK
ncbi:aminoacyl-tRNA hydrolase [Candidatus Curculioniphilus buchneri]|uniref:aminoacyl-tRNA hydrolase n=1 Tax=Candidatus Curculioniphilus buchneri TaxID=690594 RepID=UPI00376EACAB